MADLNDDIFDHCHVDLNDDGDRFVGIKGDHNNLMVYFPCGYELPKEKGDLRLEIRELFNVLAEFTTEDDRVLEIDRNAATVSVSFPIQAYRNVIEYYLDKGRYYADTETTYRISDTGDIDWERTIKKCDPLVLMDSSGNNPSFMFQSHVRKHKTPQKNELITKIHKFCVYESFKKLGIIYTPLVPEKPDLEIVPTDKAKIDSCINIIYQKRVEKKNDQDDKLFESMINMLKYYGNDNDEKQYYFGTDKFEHVWERLIDKVFGVSKEEKQKYFPRAYWRVVVGKESGKKQHPLEPDSIMILKSENGENEYYVLDAKYYRFGITGSISNLPNSSDINKQITYGAFVKMKAGGKSPYNAFIMPYNKNDNLFGVDSDLVNSAVASGDWIDHEREPHEKIQGILIDTKTLLYRYRSISNERLKQKLADEIKKQYD